MSVTWTLRSPEERWQQDVLYYIEKACEQRRLRWQTWPPLAARAYKQRGRYFHRIARANARYSCRLTEDHATRELLKRYKEIDSGKAT